MIPVQQQSSVLSFLKQRFNELENIFKGIALLNAILKKTDQKTEHSTYLYC